MTALEAAVTAALALLAALTAFALIVAVLTLGGSALLLFSVGVLVGWTIPRPRL
jgi:hypothetical protein